MNTDFNYDYHNLIYNFFKSNTDFISKDLTLLNSVNFNHPVNFKILVELTNNDTKIFKQIFSYFLNNPSQVNFLEPYGNYSFFSLYGKVLASNIVPFLQQENLIEHYLELSYQILLMKKSSDSDLLGFIGVALEILKVTNKDNYLLQINSILKLIQTQLSLPSELINFMINPHPFLENSPIKNTVLIFKDKAYPIKDLIKFLNVSTTTPLTVNFLTNQNYDLESQESYLYFPLKTSLELSLGIKNKKLIQTVYSKSTERSVCFNSNLCNLVYLFQKNSIFKDEQVLNNYLNELTVPENSVPFSFWLNLEVAISYLKDFYNPRVLFKISLKAIEEGVVSHAPHYSFSDFITALQKLKDYQTNYPLMKIVPKKPKRFLEISSYTYELPKILNNNRPISQDWEKIFKGKRIKNYIIDFPKNESDLIKVGKNLSFCLGENSYREKAINNHSQFIFLKEIENGKVKYCLEFSRKPILIGLEFLENSYASLDRFTEYSLSQAKGYKNSGVPADIEIMVTDLVLNRTKLFISKPFIKTYGITTLLAFFLSLTAYFFTDNFNAMMFLKVAATASFLFNLTIFTAHKYFIYKLCLDRYPITLLALNLVAMIYLYLN